MDAQRHDEHKDQESRYYFSNLITPPLKVFIGRLILSHYEAGKKWKKGRRFQFDIDLYRDYLFDACREAERAKLIPAHSRLEVAIILGSDESFYRELYARSEHL